MKPIECMCKLCESIIVGCISQCGYISCYDAYRDCLQFSFIYLLQKELDKVAKECSPDEAYQTLLYPGGIPDELSSYQKYKVYSETIILFLSAYKY